MQVGTTGSRASMVEREQLDEYSYHEVSERREALGLLSCCTGSHLLLLLLLLLAGGHSCRMCFQPEYSRFYHLFSKFWHFARPSTAGLDTRTRVGR
jgi:hypothetical protein